MKVYISGPISGIVGNNADAFCEAESKILSQGHEVINPHNIIAIGTSWLDYMRADIKALMDADAIYMLRGWKKSRGANIEYTLAQSLGMHIYYEV